MGKATRASFGEAIVELGAQYKNIVVIDADLGKSVKSEKFMAEYPKRYFQCGIAEANMISTAAGLALSGPIQHQKLSSLLNLQLLLHNPAYV